MEMIFMVTANYLAINKSFPKLTVHKIGSSCSENKVFIKELKLSWNTITDSWKKTGIIELVLHAVLQSTSTSSIMMIFHHQDLPQCTNSVKCCQTGFSYETTIQK